MNTKLNIKDIKVQIFSNEKLASWICHDYRYYIDNDIEIYDLKFNLFSEAYNYSKLPNLVAKLYHDDYIVYESKNSRIIDFFGYGISFYDITKKEINIYSADEDFLYEIYYLSFESLLGEKLDEKGWHRLHCLALENNGLATALLLPPGAGKSTLALKFSNHDNIRVLAEDMLIYRGKDFFGLHFRWGTSDALYANDGRLMKRKKYKDKILLDSTKFKLVQKAQPNNIILGCRISSLDSKIIKVNKLKLVYPLFKSMVLGLELQQSLAYFLLRNYKDVFLKSKIGLGRLTALIKILVSSKTHIFYMGYGIDKNFKTLELFIIGDSKKN